VAALQAGQLTRMLTKIPLVKWTAHQVFRWRRGMTLGVRGVVIDAENRVLLVRHGYVQGWHFPGGGVDKGESIHQAVAREVREETGVVIGAAPELYGFYTNFISFPGDHIALFIIRDFTVNPSHRSSFEIREHGFYPRSGLPDTTTGGTQRRLTEVFDGATPAHAW
jgi:8-oxo-dGTP pyrophosphatase MutT (NUDIX family)